jgi:hypothetical protein
MKKIIEPTEDECGEHSIVLNGETVIADGGPINNGFGFCRNVLDMTIQNHAQLPSRVVVKKQMDGYDEEFQTEVSAYAHLRDLQGEVIPKLYGIGTLHGVPAIVLSRLDAVHLLHPDLFAIPTDKLQDDLQASLERISIAGVCLEDVHLGNLLYDKNRGVMMVVDLENTHLNSGFDTRACSQEIMDGVRSERAIWRHRVGPKVSSDAMPAM